MARKVILDVDPGIDDAVAMCLALFDPNVEVVAVTAVAGNVSAEQATRNVQAVIEQLDPPRWPRVGAAASELEMNVNARHIHGANGLGDAQFAVAELVHQHPSDKVIFDEIRKAPGEVTIVALGPLTNVAAVLQRDASLATLIGQLIIMGGTYSGSGNVTAAAEFNMYCHPAAARRVFHSPITKTLIPLDVTSQMVMTYDQLDQLPGDQTRTGAFLSQILPFAFRAHRQVWGMEGIYLHDAVALVAALHPELFQMQASFADVETVGKLTTGATIFDRRRNAPQPNLDVATDLDANAVMDCILRGLQAAK